MTRPDVIAIVWARHEARTAAFAEWLGARLYNVHYLQEKRPWLAPLKYVLQWWKTWEILVRERPAYVYVTNSPPVAGLCVMSYCFVHDTQFVLDVHPPSLFVRKWAWARPLQRLAAHFARAVVVDQVRYAELFESWGATTLVLTNPPKAVPTDAFPPPQEATFTYVGTFADDEPVEILLEAARRLPHVQVYVLGDRQLARPSWVREAPANVMFTGYLVGDDYWRRLHASSAVVVLTTHAHSLSGAAQDGMRIGRPLILSDQPTLREHFPRGAVFVPNTAAGLAEGMARLDANRDELEHEVVELRNRIDRRWKQDFARLTAIVDEHGRPTAAAS